MSRGICWIRRDLRAHDHAALAAATARYDEVVVAFVFDRVILDALEDRDDRRVTFIVESLREVDSELRGHGSRLVVLEGDPVERIPDFVRQIQADGVIAARDGDPYAIARDGKVRATLQAMGADFRTVKDVTVFEKGEVLSDESRPLRVYSPFARAWRKRFVADRDAAVHEPDFSKLIDVSSPCDLESAPAGFVNSQLWLRPGSSGGQERLASMRSKLDGYGAKRDFPAADATSALSVDLRFGTVSIRECVRLALESSSPGADKWLAELIWREFYQDILSNFPSVVSTTFQPQYAEMRYPGDPEHFEAWKEGRTGYPIVDAAMRCLNATGWMHNRLRMVAASFLTKDLLIDYRWGEAYFARQLLDFDLASNNGGWQWAASVGADPQPYFRIFNPYLQSRKFDPEGTFIRRWLPEIAHLGADDIHEPGVLRGDYPAPIVDHATQRDRAIQLLASYKG